MCLQSLQSSSRSRLSGAQAAGRQPCGRRGEGRGAQWHDPTQPGRNPCWKHRAQRKTTGFAKLHQLEKGVGCQAALFLGVTFSDVWQDARHKSMGHDAGKANIARPHLPAGLSILRSCPAGGQRTGNTADNEGSGRQHPQHPSGAAAPPRRPSAPGIGTTAPAPAPTACNQKFRAREWFFPELCTLPTAFSRQEKRNP